MSLLVFAGCLLVAAGTASVQLKTEVFDNERFPQCFLHCLETVFAYSKAQCMLMCTSGCQYSMFDHVTGACNLFTDGDTSECNDITDDHQYVYRKASQTSVYAVANNKSINWFEAQRFCLALGGRLSGFTVSTSLNDVRTSLGENALWIGARKLRSGWTWLSGASVNASIVEDQNEVCLVYYRELHDEPCKNSHTMSQIRCDLH